MPYFSFYGKKLKTEGYNVDVKTLCEIYCYRRHRQPRILSIINAVLVPVLEALQNRMAGQRAEIIYEMYLSSSLVDLQRDLNLKFSEGYNDIVIRTGKDIPHPHTWTEEEDVVEIYTHDESGTSGQSNWTYGEDPIQELGQDLGTNDFVVYVPYRIYHYLDQIIQRIKQLVLLDKKFDVVIV